jgi:hypothetical protein
MKLNEITQRTDIDAICKQYGIEKYEIDNNGFVNVDAQVMLYDKNLTKIPLKFGHVTGAFNCGSNSKLTSLEGAPNWVGGNFICVTCPKLSSLKFAPTHVGGNFNIADCPKLSSLEFATPEVGGYINLNRCTGITKLEGFKKMNKFKVNQFGNKTNVIYMNEAPISNVLYVFRIKGLESIDTQNNKLDKIVNKYLADDRNIMDCQQELIDAGFAKIANLK